MWTRCPGCTPISRRRIRPPVCWRIAMRCRRSPQPTRTTAKRRSSTRYRSPPRPHRADQTFAEQRKAGAILEKLIAGQPDHPGLAHYIIHSYDFPPLADRALEAARRYAKIAPSAPHALHMPSHTFTRVGYWQESIDTNIGVRRGREARRSSGRRTAHDGLPHLCVPADGAGRVTRDGMLDALPEVAARFDPEALGSAAPGSAGVFALAAIPARYALERGAWAEAAKLEPHPSKFPYTEALTYFARAIGAARIGDAATVRSSIEALQKIQAPADAGEGRLLGRSRQRFNGDPHRHGSPLRNGVRPTPSPKCVLPRRSKTARKRLPSLRDRSRPRASSSGRCCWSSRSPRRRGPEFEATLKKEPNRFRALYGAARAASLMGDRAAAGRYHAQLLKICERADNPGRPELAEARQSR